MPGAWYWRMGGTGKSNAPGATPKANWRWKAHAYARGSGEKLLLMVTLVYAFLLSLLAAAHATRKEYSIC
jgi:hypothetical protein